ncbi:putative Ig domain-containing protein [Kitasatospora sp. NBC_01287]|uniref:putative Ig domain-containing protein n=1 Tax=Kitasatospora sp. NBC_01287 TaxID=2903573 RepID=UPI00225C2828|nr:putative Ig domain-containing protein [Kitasatospora sp. NBC_01287]MCX4744980.1 putative Ig domain-containing protein [Kitasatospora sp. NBC_01287]
MDNRPPEHHRPDHGRPDHDRPARRRRSRSRSRSATLAPLSVLGLLVASLSTAFTGTATAAPALTVAGSNGITVARSCAVPTHPGELACMALKRTDIQEKALSPQATPSGYGPTDLTSAYNLPSGGSGQTVGIVDAQDDPNAESDLAAYRSQYGLPACTTANGCFKKINENGGTSYPTPDTGWAGEISLDVDMVSAVCPNCHILLVEASSANVSDLGAAVNQAVAQGAKFVSNSYGGDEDSSVTSSDASYFNHPGVAITASAGDSDYGAEYPATSQYVTAVGGTALSRASNSRGWTERVWDTSSTEGTGSGCSAYIAKPSWQHDTGCGNRMETDVSAVADPATGVSVYQTYGGSGWSVYGGTSAASPIIASVWALAGAPNAGDRASQYPYNHTSSFNDVTSGNNGSCSVSYYCTAGTGYDGPTGWGTPNGTSGFTAGTVGESVTVSNPGSQSATVGQAVSLQLSASDSAGKALTYSATGLPAGLSISSSGLISGTPTAAGSSTSTVIASSGTASGSAGFSWTVTAAGAETITFRAPGNQSGVVGTAASLQVSASDSAGNALTYSASGLPAGLSISSSGLISGTPSAAGTSTVTVTASSGTASGSTGFSWTITAGGGGGCAGLAAWSAGTSYVPGNQVSYNGHKWLSTWYSTGAAPGAPASWSVWTDQGSC